MRLNVITTWLVLFGCAPVNRAIGDDPEPIAIADVKRADEVDFQQEVLPILRKNCLACHNATDAESDLVLETPEAIRTGGSEGPGAVPGNGAESLIVKLAAHQQDPVMPPLDNTSDAKNLTSDELGLLKLWIDQGAKGEVTDTPAPIQWRSLPEQIQPILSASVTPNGQFAACGRGNRLFIYHVPSGRFVQEVIDPSLTAGEANAARKPSAHLDLVQSLAFHPTENLLASGGFRNVKLWRRPAATKQIELSLGGEATTMAVTQDRRLAAVGTPAGPIQLWALANGQQVGTLEGHAGSIAGLAFSADGSRLVSGAADKTVRAWNVEQRQEIGRLTTPADIQAIDVVQNGSHVVTGESDNVLRVWAIPVAVNPDNADNAADSAEQQTKPVRELPGHGGPITCLAALSSQPSHIVSGSKDGTLRHWDTNDGRQLRTLQHGAPVMDAAVSADGKRFVTTGENGVAKLWNAENNQVIAEIKGDRRLDLKIADLDRSIQLVKTEVDAGKKQVEEFEKQATARAEALKKAQEAQAAADKELADKKKPHDEAQAAKTTADQRLQVATAANSEIEAVRKAIEEKRQDPNASLEDQEAQLNKTREAVAPHEELKLVIAAIDVAKQAITQFREQEQKNFDPVIGKLTELQSAAKQQMDKAKQQADELTKKADEANKQFQDATKKKKQADVNVQQTERDVTRIASSSEQAQAILAKDEQALQSQEGVKNEVTQQRDASVAPVTAAGFSTDNLGLLVLGDQQNRICVYEANTGSLCEVLEDHQAAIRDLYVAADGIVMSLGEDQRLTVWDAEPEWKLERVIGKIDEAGPLVDRVLSLDFSPNGTTLAVGSGEASRSGTISIWNVADGQLVRDIPEAHSDTVYGLEFSPSGEYLASSAADRMVKVFKVADGTFVRSFEGHTHHVLDVSWRANGKMLASAGADKVIKIWDFETGEQKRTIGGISKEVTSVAYVGIGGNTITSSGDTNTRIHDTGNGNAVRSMSGGGDFVYVAAVTSDGKRAVTGGVKSVLQVWNTDDGKLIHAFAPPQSEKPENENGE